MSKDNTHYNSMLQKFRGIEECAKNLWSQYRAKVITLSELQDKLNNCVVFYSSDSWTADESGQWYKAENREWIRASSPVSLLENIKTTDEVLSEGSIVLYRSSRDGLTPMRPALPPMPDEEKDN